MVGHAELRIPTQAARELLDITDPVSAAVRAAGIHDGICHVFVAGATASIVIHEGDDPALRDDLLDALDRTIPRGRWRHDRIDHNGAAHIQSAWTGASEVVPVRKGDLALGTWQRIFLCEFDGPRANRVITLTILGESSQG